MNVCQVSAHSVAKPYTLTFYPRQEIRFPDGTLKRVQLDGEEEMVFSDGTIQRVTRDGQSVIDFPDGQREVHTNSYSQRRCVWWWGNGFLGTFFPKPFISVSLCTPLHRLTSPPLDIRTGR